MRTIRRTACNTDDRKNRGNASVLMSTTVFCIKKISANGIKREMQLKSESCCCILKLHWKCLWKDKRDKFGWRYSMLQCIVCANALVFLPQYVTDVVLETVYPVWDWYFSQVYSPINMCMFSLLMNPKSMYSWSSIQIMHSSTSCVCMCLGQGRIEGVMRVFDGFKKCSVEVWVFKVCVCVCVVGVVQELIIVDLRKVCGREVCSWHECPCRQSKSHWNTSG